MGLLAASGGERAGRQVVGFDSGRAEAHVARLHGFPARRRGIGRRRVHVVERGVDDEPESGDPHHAPTGRCLVAGLQNEWGRDRVAGELGQGAVRADKPLEGDSFVLRRHPSDVQGGREGHMHPGEVGPVGLERRVDRIVSMKALRSGGWGLGRQGHSEKKDRRGHVGSSVDADLAVKPAAPAGRS